MNKVFYAVSLSILVSGLLPFNAPATETVATIQMRVKSVTIDPTSQTPVVILENTQDKMLLPIWIDVPEARSIALELEHVTSPRPLTHDLIRNILQGVGASLQRITITELRNSTYYAIITLKLKGQEVEIDSRPSDAIAVALRMKAPIYASTQVLAKARQLPAPSGQKEGLRKTFGIHIQDLTPELASLFDLQAQHGVLVADVELGSPAQEGGLQRGDVIVKVNDTTVSKSAQLESYLKRLKKPAQVRMEVLRKGKPASVVVELP